MALAAAALLPRGAYAYPDAEILGTGSVDPPFDVGVTSTATGFILLSDEELAVSFAETLSLVDLGRYDLETLQPPALSEDEENDGRLMAIAYDADRNDIIAALDTGRVLVFNLDDVTADPLVIQLDEAGELGPIAFDNNRNIAYVADNTNLVVYKVDINAQTILATIALPTDVSTFTVTDALWNSTGDEAWFSTDVGAVLYIPAASTTAAAIAIAGTEKPTISAIALTPLATFVYALIVSAEDPDDPTQLIPAVFKIDTATHALVPIATGGKDRIRITDNPAPSDLVITDVVDPTAIYGYVAGQGPTTGAITVFNTATDTVIDLNPDVDPDKVSLPTSAMPYLLAPSSAADGNVYMSYSTGNLGIISENPFIDITSVTYSDGSQSLKKNGSFMMTFTSDQAGTATVRANGDAAGSGTILKDSAGATSWTVAAATATSLTFNQADNSAALEEGENNVWVFVNAGGTLKGRRAALVTVDTPPPNVVIRSAGFGGGRIYVNFDRLTASDMASYNVYTDTDPAAVLTKTAVSASIAQTSSGSTISGTVSGLINGTIYYIAMEGVDAGGNVSEARTNTFSDGTIAWGMPEATVGPAGLLGEKGCSLTAGAPEGADARRIAGSAVGLVVAALALMLFARRSARRGAVLTILLSILLLPAVAAAQAVGQEVVERSVPAYGAHKESPQMWSAEVGAGFWLPKNQVLDAFFTKCCNVMPSVRAGALFQKRYGIEGGVSFLTKSAAEVGALSGVASQDRFTLMLVPLETNFVWRADYFSWRYLVPYVRTGVDYVYFREKDVGNTIQGMKYGVHGEGGLQINIGEIGDASDIMDADTGINDLFLTLSARYQWINNFGGGGLDLSGYVFGIGILMEL